MGAIPATVLLLILAVVGLGLDLVLPLGASGGVQYTLLVLVSLWAERRSFIVLSAELATVLTLLGGWVAPPSEVPWIALLHRGMTVAAIWGIAFFLLRYRQTRERLEAERLQAQGILEVAEVVLLVLDDEGRVRMINRKGSEILGRTPEALQGADWFETAVPPEDREAQRAAYRRLLEDPSARSRRQESTVRRADGQIRVVAWHHRILRKPSGRALGVLSSGEDITEQKAAEAELRRYHRALEDLKYALDQSAIVAITDAQGRITYVNDKFCEISKYARDELLGKDHRILNSGYHPKAFMRDLWRTIGRGRVWRGQIRNRARDGTFYWVDTTIVPFLDERGKPYQYMAIHYDITERKQAEDELRRREALARLGQMAAVVAHEVKNPLAGIAGAVEIIGSHLPENHPDRRVIATILQRIEALNERVQDLLRFSRPRPPQLAPVRVEAAVRDAAQLLSRDPRWSGVSIEIEGAAPPALGDEDLLREVLLNLLLNAAQAMDGRGKIRVSVGAADGRCILEIRDSGPGIPEGVRDKVLEPFFTTKSQGTGLGLPIALQVIEAHGGALEMDFPAEGGAVFRIQLPLAGVLSTA